MVVKMMKWRPWPPAPGKKFEVKLVLRRLKGLSSIHSPESEVEERFRRLMVEIKWKGPRNSGLGSVGKRSKRDFTGEMGVGEDGVVEWNEEFHNMCNFSVYKESCFRPWEVSFSIFGDLNQTSKNKVTLFGTGSLDLAEFASVAEGNELETSVQLAVPGKSIEFGPLLCLSLSLLELRVSQEPLELMGSFPLSPRSAYAFKAGLRKVKMLTDYVSPQRAKKASCEEKGSDSDSLDDFEDGESEEVEKDSGVSFSYGTLSSLYSNRVLGSENEDTLYYRNREPDEGPLPSEGPTSLGLNQPFQRSSKYGILSWKKGKLKFRLPKEKGEPLLKSYYGEEGGDDIDFDRRQFSSADESLFGWDKLENDSLGNMSPVSEFGDDNFAIGSWELKEVMSRDGHMKLQTQAFFASIDQRSERVAGESACTTIVAVLADWFQSNRHEMPIQSQFDSLIRDGSLEWRKLCENDAYKEQFPDRHFDLDTVLEMKIRPLSVVPEKSFVGFFHPEGDFNFLQGSMSFDSIWDEVSHCRLECNGDPLVYIVSWNDHFFVLKIDLDAYYIIDTLGERFYEGCNQAHILKFDKDTTIQLLAHGTQASDETPPSDHKVKTEKTAEKDVITDSSEAGNRACSEEAVFCRGKESCKEYIKSFLAAIPVRELQTDIKKGLMTSASLHQRLQIEFHYTHVQ